MGTVAVLPILASNIYHVCANALSNIVIINVSRVEKGRPLIVKSLESVPWPLGRILILWLIKIA